MCFLLGGGSGRLVQAKIDMVKPNPAKKADPVSGYSSWTKREKLIFEAMYKLAQEHWPALTKAQYKAQLKVIWDGLK